MNSVVKKIRVKNPYGLHTRPATMIVQCLQKYKSDVTVTYNKETVDARSILNLLLLAVQKNGEIVIEASGVDAMETMEKLIELFQNQFGEKDPNE